MHPDIPIAKTSSPLAQPPWCGLGKKLESSLRKAVYTYDMLHGVDKLAVALSGGKDSLSLLYMLKAVSGRGMPPFELVAINVAGEFTCGAGVGQKFLESVCASLNVPLITCESHRTLETLECYGCSRERRSLLFAAAKEAGCTTIAFGHHSDDNAQTLLMNLFHKGEFAGLLPKIKMVDYGVTIIRPLILTEEQLIKEFAKTYGFSRITCQCPVGQTSKRKKTDDLIKDIEEHFPHARTNLSQAALLYGSQKANHAGGSMAAANGSSTST
ncbi:MAG: ttcA [Chlamydiia bacterium]|nr:ttcA [Chlamydiia bacterium]